MNEDGNVFEKMERSVSFLYNDVNEGGKWLGYRCEMDGDGCFVDWDGQGGQSGESGESGERGATGASVNTEYELISASYVHSKSGKKSGFRLTLCDLREQQGHLSTSQIAPLVD